MKQESHGLPSRFLSNSFKQWMLDKWVIAFGTAGASRRWALVALGSSLEGLPKLHTPLPSPMLSCLTGFRRFVRSPGS